MKEYLISLGGLIYLPELSDDVILWAPPEDTCFEIIDIPFVTGEEYDQFKFVCRQTAEILVAKYPDMWKVEKR